MEPLELRGADLSLRLADGSISGIPRGFLILYYSVVSYYYTADEGKPVWTVPLHATVAFTGNNSSEILRDNDANKESIILEVYL